MDGRAWWDVHADAVGEAPFLAAGQTDDQATPVRPSIAEGNPEDEVRHGQIEAVQVEG